MNVAVIPARGGSKRVPRKNVATFCGRPMIAWSIDAARASGCFDRILVSTDDSEIAGVAQALGVEVPFLRPGELADDFTGTVPVVQHAVEWLQDANVSPAAVCCLYATAPFVQPADLAAGLAALSKVDCEYAISVTRYAYPVQRALVRDVDGRLKMREPEHVSSRSQDLPDAFHDAAQFYWAQPETWLSGKPILTARIAPVELPRDRVQDIDTPEDWRRAEIVFELLRQRAALRTIEEAK